MDDLFDQLKSAGPLTSNSIPAKTVASTKSNSPAKSALNSKNAKFLEELDIKHNSSSGGMRRESLPSPTFVGNIKKLKSQKARSLSPPKYDINNTIKSLKVKLERKKIEEFLTRPLEEHTSNIRAKQDNKDSKQQKKSTLTKAQQKLFEPLKQKKTKAQVLKEFNIKPCKVRIHRDNLEQLSKEYKNKNTVKRDGKSKSVKRTISSSFSGSPPAKKGKLSAFDAKSAKSKNSFFIKLTSSPSSKLEKKLKNMSKPSSSSTSSPSSVALHNKIKNSKFSTSVTTPTKFSRSQLLRSFGKRFFNVQVKIERCSHPLMLTFESNDRARRLQAKRNKSKNLSVSFREQVEIFGDSSDSDDSYDEDFCAAPNRNSRKNSYTHTSPVPVTPVVMPARLKKVENGKVVDDIELDPSLFVDPKSLVVSTPFSPLRKKRDHKSFSPLKDESTPSPRKEQLKLANERIPPSGLRRLNIDEDDDEDDDCEYIVPIEMPQRRTSRTSSNTTLEDLISTIVPLAESTGNFPMLFNNDDDNFQLVGDINLNEDKDKTYNMGTGNSLPSETLNLENGSNDSFQSAKDIIEKDSEQDAEKLDDNQFKNFTLPQSSPLQEEMTANKPVESEQIQRNGEKEQNPGANGKHLNILDTINTMDNISMNLFLEDSQTNNANHTKSFVDSLIDETIDKLTKDIDDSGAGK